MMREWCSVPLVYDDEMSFQSLYLSLKKDGFDALTDNGKWCISQYMHCRQQCMFACVCFVLMFFAIYDSVLVSDLHNFEWFCATVMQSGCVTVF